MIHMLCVMSGTGLDHFGKVLLRDMVSLYVCMFSMYVCMYVHTHVYTHTLTSTRLVTIASCGARCVYVQGREVVRVYK
jgi:hypothetical protein